MFLSFGCSHSISVLYDSLSSCDFAKWHCMKLMKILSTDTLQYRNNTYHLLYEFHITKEKTYTFSVQCIVAWAMSNSWMCLEASHTSSSALMQRTNLNYPISRIITCAVLPKIDEMQQTLNPLERIATLSKFNRWSCKRYPFSWIQSPLCHLCWLS